MALRGLPLVAAGQNAQPQRPPALARSGRPCAAGLDLAAHAPDRPPLGAAAATRALRAWGAPTAAVAACLRAESSGTR
jgi:hypothetical protein